MLGIYSVFGVEVISGSFGKKLSEDMLITYPFFLRLDPGFGSGSDLNGFKDLECKL